MAGAKSETEERGVSKDELKAGIKLAAGHPVILVVSGHPASGEATSPGSEGTADVGGGTSTAAAATGEGTAGGDSTAEEGTGAATGEGTGGEGTAGQGTGGKGTAAPDTPPEVTPSVLGRIDAAHFETDKSFPLPEAIRTFRAVAALCNREPARVLLLVGHTDTQGPDAHNLDLSDDRARSVAAYLRDDADAWMGFYQPHRTSAQWGLREDQLMLAATLAADGTPYYAGAIDGAAGPQTRTAVARFKKDKGLAGSALDAAARRALVLAYMSAEGTSVPEATQVQTLGCGVRHLEVQTGPGVSEPRNRRVDVFAFEGPPIRPAPEECKGGAHPGCTVYDRWKQEVTGPIPGPGPSPGTLEGRLVYRDGSPAANVPFLVEAGGAKKGGFTDAQGNFRVAGVGGEARFRLVDGLPLAAQAGDAGERVVAMTASGGSAGTA